MKILIEYSETKRAIDGPFNICGSGDDLRIIANDILSAVDEDKPFYGWISISKKQEPIANTPPEEWDNVPQNKNNIIKEIEYLENKIDELKRNL